MAVNYAYEFEARTEQETPLPGFKAHPLKVNWKGLIAALPKSLEPED